jgi:hypothetical protein
MRPETTTAWFAVERPRMAAHKFKIGQRVTLESKRYGVWAEPSEVVRLLPNENGISQYRARSVRDGHERVVLESELA